MVCVGLIFQCRCLGWFSWPMFLSSFNSSKTKDSIQVESVITLNVISCQYGCSLICWFNFSKVMHHIGLGDLFLSLMLFRNDVVRLYESDYDIISLKTVYTDQSLLSKIGNWITTNLEMVDLYLHINILVPRSQHLQQSTVDNEEYFLFYVVIIIW